MKKSHIVLFLVLLILVQSTLVFALTEGEARQAWIDAKQTSRELQQIHRDAKVDYAVDRTPENDALVVSTGKDVLIAALDEAQAWLEWKQIQASESTEISEELKAVIEADIQSNLAKISDLRTDVDGIDSQLELGLVFLKMIGKYVELLTDVARDWGKILVELGNAHLSTSEAYELKLREAAQGIDDNAEIIAALDSAKNSLVEARSNVSKAEASYELVVLPGTPLIKFAEGNDYMRTARSNLLSAVASMNRAYALIYASGE